MVPRQDTLTSILRLDATVQSSASQSTIDQSVP